MIGRPEEKRSYFVRPERMCVGWTKHLVNKLSEPYEVVVDRFSGMFATAKKRCKRMQYRPLSGCEIDIEYFAASKKALVETFVRDV